MLGERTWRVMALLIAFSAACRGDGASVETPSVMAVTPACGDNATTTAVSVSGSLPVKPVIWVSDPASSKLETSYQAWVGDVELTSVAWHDGTELTAVVPAGMSVGTYALTLQSPYGTKGTKEAAFQVRTGPCPVETAALAITNPFAAPATASVGQELTVTATVQNNGQANALGVLALIVAAPAGLTFKGGPAGPQDVPAGQARTFTWTYTATTPGSGVFVIDAAGTAADSGLPVAAPRVNTNAVLVNPESFLTANTTVAPAEATVGQLITVALTVTNHTTTAVVATPSIVVSGPVTAGNTPAAQSIPGGSTLAFQWTFTANAAGLASFTASVSGINPGTGLQVTVPTATSTVTVQGPPGLAATLAIPATIELGDFTVTMLVTNTGGASAANVVEVVPDLPTKTSSSSAGVVPKSGPTGAPATVVGGQPAVAFTWVFTATSPGALTLTSTARGRDANTGASIVSAAANSNLAQVGLHTVGGTVSGLAGTGLTLHNGTESLPITANGTYAFATPAGTGTTYSVTVTVQPLNPSQTCTVANGTGTMGTANVTNVNVSCSTNSFTVGGTVTGLAVGSTGVTLHNGADNPIITANGPFTFATAIMSGATYSVTATDPTSPSQHCVVANGTGTMGAANVTNVTVTCATTSFTVGGTVSGLAVSSNGVTLHNGGDNPTITANGAFTFATAVPSGATYSVTATDPTNPSQHCTVANGTGTIGAANVTNVTVTCATNSFTVGGTVSGLAGTGLVLSNNGGPGLTISAGATSYVFPTSIASGTPYAVTVTAQPTGPSQTCNVANGSGTVGTGNVTNVNVSCSTSTFTVGGTVTGLTGTGLVLHNGSENLTVAANGAYVFATPVASGGSYAVTVTVQPLNPSQTCTVANGSGTVGATNVTAVTVTCTTNSFTVGGTVTGLTGTGLVLSNNGGPGLTIPAGATSYVFSPPTASGTPYAVTVTAQPTGPSQTCNVANGSGTVGTGNVTNVNVTCAP
jgi:hypothetical protein